MDDREVAIAAAKQRMAAFRLRQAPSMATPPDVVPPSKHHARSHSRNNSVTSFPLSSSTANNAPLADDPLETPASVPNSPSPRSRPNSHHRRRSSVSTRRESAEMMGVAPPPEISSDMTGDPTELRRLALWALEGKGRSDNAFIGFTKVEIPELDTSDAEGNFDPLQPPKAKPTLSAFGMGNPLVGKRDSFGKLLMSSSNSLKDQLHTLMEEEEEEEEETEKEKEKDLAPPTSELNSSFRDESPFRTESPFHDEVPRPLASAPGRHRPTNLTLRPLSLTPESLPVSRAEGLPTPSPTPSPRVGGLKALTLAPSSSPAPSNSSISSISSSASRRQSMSASPPPQPTEQVQRRQSFGAVATPPMPARKSSIGYRRTPSGDHPSGYLPTPGPTPTSPMPPPLHVTLPVASPAPSMSSGAAELERPLSPTEQAFLFRSHTSLLCRISDLEKAIADGRGRLPPGAGVPVGFGMETLDSRSPSHERPTSTMSASSSSVSESDSVPSDEMLQLVADLKAERDELMRDAAGWRARTADLERQVGTLTRRVEAERREAWVVRERLGVVEVEKKRVREEAERTRLELRGLEKTLEAEVEARMRAEEARDEEYARCEAAEREAEALRGEMALLRSRAEQADADLQSLLVTPKVDVRLQMPLRRLNSVDSGASGSTTDVEEYVPFGLRTLKLNAVAEEEERDLPRDVTSEGGSGSEMDEDEDELAHYEDDDGLDDDMLFSDDQTSSSFGSIARSNSHLMRLDLAAVAPTPAPVPSHTKTGSMERGWSFPVQPASAKRVVSKVDHSFECFDALDEGEAEAEGGLSTYDSTTAKQSWRAAMQADDEDDEMPPFVLPAQPSKEKEWKEVEAAKLEVVAEEEDDEEEEGSVPFRFPFSADQTAHDDFFKSDPVTPRPRTNPAPVGTPTKVHKARRTSKDMTIPGFKPYSGSVPVLKAPPPPRRSSSPAKVSPMTPTTKTPEPALKQASPTQIPQLNRSPPPSSVMTPSKPRVSLPGPTFIPRPSMSPKPFPTIRTPTKPTSTTANTKISTPTSPAKTPMPPVFMPQPRLSGKPVTRSSLLPPSPEPRVLTRLALPQQNIAPQGLTAKLSQQVQSFTSLWSPWSPSAPTPEPERRVSVYIGKERQLERLRVRVQREDASVMPCAPCAGCRDGMIEI